MAEQLKAWLIRVIQLVAILVCAVVIKKASPYVALYLDDPQLVQYGNWTAFLFGGVASGYVVCKCLAWKVGFNDLLARARDGDIGSAIGALALAIIMAAIILASVPAKANEIPANAKRYIPILLDAQRTYWPELRTPSVLAAQVHQENPAWNTHARLKTAREEGIGLGQATRTARFDTLAELVAAYPKPLAGWSWDQPTLYDPTLQLRALVLKDRQNANAIHGAADQLSQLSMMLYAYNAGPGNLQADRTTCRAIKGCDPGRWFANVEKSCYRAHVTVKGYGGRSFTQISHEYVSTIMLVLRPRYMHAVGEV